MPTLYKPKQRNSDYKKQNTASKAYNCSQWRNLRASYLMQHPLCERCLQKEIISPAIEVHHIIPISTFDDELRQKDLLLDGNNLMALCKECHHTIHKNKKGNTI